MDFENKQLDSENLSQKDIMQFLLHSTQHVATREELQSVKQELKADNLSLKQELKADNAILREELQSVKQELKADNLSLKQELKADITTLKQELKAEIKDIRSEIKDVNIKIDKFLWIVVTGMLALFFKEYIFSLLAH